MDILQEHVRALTRLLFTCMVLVRDRPSQLVPLASSLRNVPSTHPSWHAMPIHTCLFYLKAAFRTTNSPIIYLYISRGPVASGPPCPWLSHWRMTFLLPYPTKLDVFFHIVICMFPTVLFVTLNASLPTGTCRLPKTDIQLFKLTAPIPRGMVLQLHIARFSIHGSWLGWAF